MKHKPSFHESFETGDDDVKGSSDRGFGIVFTVFFAILAGIKFALGSDWAWLWTGLAAATLAVTLIRASLLASLNRLWMKLGLALHRVLNPLIMGLIFYGVFAPFGLVMRLFGWDGLRRKIDRGADSYWIDRDPPGPEPDSMKMQF